MRKLRRTNHSTWWPVHPADVRTHDHWASKSEAGANPHSVIRGDDEWSDHRKLITLTLRCISPYMSVSRGTFNRTWKGIRAYPKKGTVPLSSKGQSPFSDRLLVF